MLHYLHSYRLSLGVAVCIAMLSLLRPPGSGLSTPVGLDKVGHAFMYATLSGVLWMEFLRKYRHGVAPLLHAVWGAVVAPAVLGAAMELCQGLMSTNRTADVWDLVANLVGIALATVYGYGSRCKHRGR